MPDFCHLHCHTQFSLLDGASSIEGMVKKAVENEMKAIAITDHGNMFGAFKFVAECNKKGIKPIVGCEFYVVDDRHKNKFSRENGDVRHHQLLLAKNAQGYKNLAKLCSLGYIEGLYGKYPRIDKELILKYHEGLIATTCCIGAEIPQTILKQGEEEAEEKFKWWVDLFGDDYYVEIQRHGMEEQEKVNEVLMRFSKKYNVKMIVSNDSHYLDKENANAHDILLCINTGDVQSTPKGDFKGMRFGFPNDEFYFKTKDEMSNLFIDLPQAVENTIEIADKIEKLDLKKQVMLPAFPIPSPFTNADEFLNHLTFAGAKKRYGEINAEVEERLTYELSVIKKMGFAGYFLIVSDFCDAAKKMNVAVGPGRGSAAGSAVAYCIGITNIDPVKYQLLFERFLNPERGSMPDIDTDFDDAGRQKVIDYVIDKYGQNQVAQIITYGSMKAKTAIKDVARALELPLDESNLLSKLVPEIPGITYDQIYDLKETNLKDISKNPDDIAGILKLREIIGQDNHQARVLKEARLLEGSVRNAGVHASAVIIAPSDLSEIIPVCTLKDSTMWVTQFDGKVVEDAGLLKMDFLGLRTLNIIKHAIELIEQNHQIKIIPDEIPLDDTATLELFQRGDTNGVFQFESDGMKKVLRDLKPTRLEDLIAVNALFRPGPIQYIPNFVNRKHGREKITYDLDEMAEFLEITYGITVYQEQVMLLSQKLANFSKADADTLRKAMGKKDKGTLDKMKSQFMEGCLANTHDLKICEKIWVDWEKFAEYAFNKSHATCYAYLANQTAYLKANYAPEFLASILTHNSGNIDQITFFMDECKRMNIQVKGPDINESEVNFSVNDKGEIRFGLGAIKGIGEAATLALIEQRKSGGQYSSIFDLVSRANLRTVNKKSMEALALAGAFDLWGMNRSQYLEKSEAATLSGIEIAIKYGGQIQESNASNQNSLFSGSDSAKISEPKLPFIEEWNPIEKLNKEKEVAGMFISGHPLDSFKLDLQLYTNTKISDLEKLELLAGKEIKFAGMVTMFEEKLTKTGKPWAKFILEDYSSAKEFALFGNDFAAFRPFLQLNAMLFGTASTVKSYRNPEELELKFNKLSYLADLKVNHLKNVHLHLSTHQINKTTLDSLLKLIKENKGPANLKLSIFDPVSKHKTDLFSRTLKIDWNTTLQKELELMDILVKVN